MGAPAPPWGDLQYCKPFYTWGSTQILPTGALSRDKSRIIPLRSLRTANPPNFNPPKGGCLLGVYWIACSRSTIMPLIILSSFETKERRGACSMHWRQ
jgi:hypothetical protein